MGLADMYALPSFDPFGILHNSTMNWQAEKANDIQLKSAQQQADNTQQALAARQALDFNDPNALRKYAAQYPEYSKGITDYLANHSEQERQALLADTSKVQSLLNYGDTENAIKFLEDKAVAYDNAKNPTKAADYRSMAGLVKTNKNAALQSLQMLYSNAAGKDAMAGYKDFMGATTPTVKEFNSGGATNAYIIDPITKQVTVKELAKNTVDPTQEANFKNQLKMNENDNATSRANNINTNNTQVTTANIQQKTQWGVADRNNTGAMQRAELEAQSRERIAQAQQYFQKQQAEIASGYFEPKPMNGMMYLVNKRGEYKKMLDENGNHMVANGAVDSTTRGKVAELQGLNDQGNQLIQSLQRAKELSKQGIYSGYGASGRADAMGFFGGTEESKRTQEYTNIIVNSALQSLKSVFGGAPTEGERAMLIKVQASADYPADVREKILDQAIAMAQAKIASNNRQMQTLSGQPPSYPAASAPPASIAKPQQQAPSKGQAARDKHFTGK